MPLSHSPVIVARSIVARLIAAGSMLPGSSIVPASMAWLLRLPHTVGTKKSCRLCRRRQAVFLDLVKQRPIADVQQTSCRFPVPVCLFERVGNCAALGFPFCVFYQQFQGRLFFRSVQARRVNAGCRAAVSVSVSTLTC